MAGVPAYGHRAADGGEPRPLAVGERRQVGGGKRGPGLGHGGSPFAGVVRGVVSSPGAGLGVVPLEGAPGGGEDAGVSWGLMTNESHSGDSGGGRLVGLRCSRRSASRRASWAVYPVSQCGRQSCPAGAWQVSQGSVKSSEGRHGRGSWLGVPPMAAYGMSSLRCCWARRREASRCAVARSHVPPPGGLWDQRPAISRRRQRAVSADPIQRPWPGSSPRATSATFAIERRSPFLCA